MQPDSQDIEAVTVTTTMDSCAPVLLPHSQLTFLPAQLLTRRRVAMIGNSGMFPVTLVDVHAHIPFSLWAATGQAALESARILVLGASATSTSVLKNLVLPGVGHFTILDHRAVSPADAGNNFFLEGPSSIGKNRAEEAVRLLSELNDGVEGRADTRDIEQLLKDNAGWDWIKTFSIIIAHNLDNSLLDKLSATLWEDADSPSLIAVRSAGFLAEFYIQFREQQSTFSRLHTLVVS